MFVIAKIIKKLFALTWNRVAVNVSSMPVILGSTLNDWLRRIQTKHHDGMLRDPQKFPKLSIDVAIQPQVLSVYALTSQLYILLYNA